MPRKPRPINPRRAALAKLMEIRRIADAMTRRWRFIPSTRYYHNADGQLGWWGPRDRRDIPASEYIENDPRYWVELWHQMNDLAKQAAEVRRFAYNEYVRTGGTLNG